MKAKFILMFLVYAFSCFAQARETRSYARVPNDPAVQKLIVETNNYINQNADVPSEFNAQTYEVYLREGETIQQVLKSLIKNECWGECSVDPDIKLMPLSQLKAFKFIEAVVMDETFGANLTKKMIESTKSSYKTRTRTFAEESYSDGGSFWSPLIYIVTADSDEPERFEIVKFEYIEGK